MKAAYLVIVVVLASCPAIAKTTCDSAAVRKVALEVAGRDLDEGIPAANVTDARTVKAAGGLTCDVTVKWADKEWQTFRITVQRKP